MAVADVSDVALPDVTAVVDSPVDVRRRAPRQVLTWAAPAWVSLLVALAVLAPVLPIPDPNVGGIPVSARPFGDHFLGTDQLGRDMLSRIIWGARTSLTMAVLAVGLAILVGVPLGLLAGYFRGKVDAVVVAVSDIMLAFPGLVLLLVIAAVVGPSTRNLVLASALFQVPTYIRITRANTMAFAQREFVAASRGLGAGEVRIAVLDVLPNVLPSVRAYALASCGIVFIVEGSLSFLGLGVQPPTPAWGSMIEAGRPQLERAPHQVLVPAVVLFVTVLAFNALAERRRSTPTPA